MQSNDYIWALSSQPIAGFPVSQRGSLSTPFFILILTAEHFQGLKAPVVSPAAPSFPPDKVVWTK